MFKIVNFRALRLAFTLSLSCLVFSLGLFEFICWRTTIYQDRRTDAFLLEKKGALSSSILKGSIDVFTPHPTSKGMRELTVLALFSPTLTPIAGNLPAIPKNLPLDGEPHTIESPHWGLSGNQANLIRTVAFRMPGGNILVLGSSLSDVMELRKVVAQALLKGVVPTVVFTILVSSLISWRAMRRVRLIDQTLYRIMQGELGERLPTGRGDDSIDSLARSVNSMLDTISVLLDELKDVGHNIAHDLRTPLARVRARLDRSRQQALLDSSLAQTVDQAIMELDQTATTIAALLRIGELEDGRRRVAFNDLSLTHLVEDVVEVYGPVAEQKDIALVNRSEADVDLYGDWDLLTEALSNLVENAIKFTPKGGEINLKIFCDERGAVLAVSDTGIGIPRAERFAVFERFYRGSPDKSGSGLGLSLVRAICRLHGFTVQVADSDSGCMIEIMLGDEVRLAESTIPITVDRRHFLPGGLNTMPDDSQG